MASTIRRIAVLTGGTDGPGMNAAIRAVVRMALDLEWSVMGVHQGFLGLQRGDLSPLDSRSVSHRIDRGGTFLGTFQGEAFVSDKDLRSALRNLNELGLGALVVIGGPSCARGAHILSEAGFPVVLVPASIENDLWGTDSAIGVDTAMNTAMEAIDHVKDTASSRQQAFVVELVGAHSGFLTLMTGIVSGAEITCIPEIAYSLEQITEQVAATYVRGKEHCIILVAEGAQPDAHAIWAHLVERQEQTGFDANLTMVGHIQRGGAPMARDRILATRLGAAAVQALAEDASDVMVGVAAGRTVLVPLVDVLANQKQVDQRYISLADMLAR
jgi:6-phosphofructokinase 1